jgi:hypothetical protein
VAGVEEGKRDVRPDEAASAGQQDAHDIFFSLNFAIFDAPIRNPPRSDGDPYYSVGDLASDGAPRTDARSGRGNFGAQGNQTGQNDLFADSKLG